MDKISVCGRMFTWTFPFPFIGKTYTVYMFLICNNNRSKHCRNPACFKFVAVFQLRYKYVAVQIFGLHQTRLVRKVLYVHFGSNFISFNYHEIIE